MKFKVRTTPTQLARATGHTRYWVRLEKYQGKHFCGFVHISDQLFPTRIEALRFGRTEAKKRQVTA